LIEEKTELPWSFTGYHADLAVKALRCSLKERLVKEVVAPLAVLLAASRRSRRELTAPLRRESPQTAGNSARTRRRQNMSINLYITDEHTATGFREATLDEIMSAAVASRRCRFFAKPR
jgi:hypothetical protein